MLRREFLRASLASGVLLPFGRAAWAGRFAAAGPRLIVVFLRGAVDGLNVVVPYSEAAYYDYRPTIAVAGPGNNDGVRDLDGRFGLHPALAGLMALWQQRQLAFVHACGSPDPDRSHFEAQAYMETATPGVASTTTGWMNRLAAAMHLEGPSNVVAFGASTPLIVRGASLVATFPTGRAAAQPEPMDRDPVRQAFDPLYARDQRLAPIWYEAERARARLLTDLQADMMASSEGAPDAQGFATDTTHAARMMVADPGIRLVFFQLGGWDTHVNQGAGQGQLAGHLKFLADGLLALQMGLGSIWNDTAVLVISEFGRTAHENGNRGTDHGHGNAHWLLGGQIGGGKVYADWRGLSEDALHQQRDLPVTTDFRSLIALVLERHLKLHPTALKAVLPSFTPDYRNISTLLAA
jgi:uncharacterized protein (DUF1501 family)